jgi:hypothetical protein
MAEPSPTDSLEELIEQWRNHLLRAATVRADDLPSMEAQLRAEISGLIGAGLSPDEAFLVAARRLGRRDRRATAGALAADAGLGIAAAPAGSGPHPALARTEAIVAFSLAVLAAVAIKAPALFGIDANQHEHEAFYQRNLSLFVLPCLAGYFVWKRRLALRTVGWLAAAFVAAAIFANLPAFGGHRQFVELTALHLPIALLLAVGVAHAGGRWADVGARMDFIRFSGELFIYYVLIALGGAVLCAFMALTFKSIGINIGPFLGSWLVPCGAAGAVLVASWLVEAKKGVMENMAPMLTRLFTPLFAAMLVAFLVAMLVSGRGIAIERELLIGFDLLLVVVLGLLLYSISSRNPRSAPGPFDVVQVVLVASALLADAFALWAIGARISEFGFSPNRVAALGENIILLINLAGSAVLYVRFLLGRGSFVNLERWQTRYLPVYAAWAAFVVIVFPPLFRWIA